MKKRITIICLTVISVADCIFNKGLGPSILLWIGYGIYKSSYQETQEEDNIEGGASGS